MFFSTSPVFLLLLPPSPLLFFTCFSCNLKDKSNHRGFNPLHHVNVDDDEPCIHKNCDCDGHTSINEKNHHPNRSSHNSRQNKKETHKSHKYYYFDRWPHKSFFEWSMHSSDSFIFMSMPIVMDYGQWNCCKAPHLVLVGVVRL